jgi:transaldolase
MKFFIDGADPKEIRTCVEQGLIDGVTTNPTLISKAIAAGSQAREPNALLKEICDICKGPVSAEVVSEDKDGMMREAHEYAKIAPNIVVKLPLTTEGLKAVRVCAAEKIKTNVTLCFSPVQAILAAKAGAGYISPFVGRLDDIATDGMEVVRQIVTIYRQYDFKTEVLVASVRGPNHIVEAALVGAQVATVPFAVLQTLVKHPLTDIGLAKFLADWKKLPK